MRMATTVRSCWKKAAPSIYPTPTRPLKQSFSQSRLRTTLALSNSQDTLMPSTVATEAAVVIERQQQETVLEPAAGPPFPRGEMLLGKSPEDLKELMLKCGAERYRADQIMTCLLQGVKRIDDMNYIPKALRANLKELGYRTGRSHIHSALKAGDGTTKFLLQLIDGRVVETVAIPASRSDRPRLTACVSSQVGCALKCTFCATAKGGLGRNLQPYEIVDQVLTIQEEMQQPVTHIVLMGMGEPLMNLNKVLRAYDWMHSHLNISARNVTLSTVGVPKGIRLLGERKLQITLAVSLHAPDQLLRQQLVPSARNYPMHKLFDDCRWYFRQTGRRVTFEYALLKGVNDSEEQAEKLGKVMIKNRCLAHVNLMLWNKVEGIDYERPEWETAQNFKKVLESLGITVTIRKSRGLEKTAACGQLHNDFQKRPVRDYVSLG